MTRNAVLVWEIKKEKKEQNMRGIIKVLKVNLDVSNMWWCLDMVDLKIKYRTNLLRWPSSLILRVTVNFSPYIFFFFFLFIVIDKLVSIVTYSQIACTFGKLSNMYSLYFILRYLKIQYFEESINTNLTTLFNLF